MRVIQQAATEAAPYEACGLLLGAPGSVRHFDEATRIEDAKPVANVANSPLTHFEVDPSALFAAIKDERRGGPKMLGYFHSHPSRDANPSRTDAQMAEPDGKIWIIVAGEQLTAWRAGDTGLFNRFEPLQFRITG